MEVLELALPADRSLGVRGPALLEARRGSPRGGLVLELGRSLPLELCRGVLLKMRDSLS